MVQVCKAIQTGYFLVLMKVCREGRIVGQKDYALGAVQEWCCFGDNGTGSAGYPLEAASVGFAQGPHWRLIKHPVGKRKFQLKWYERHFQQQGFLERCGAVFGGAVPVLSHLCGGGVLARDCWGVQTGLERGISLCYPVQIEYLCQFNLHALHAQNGKRKSIKGKIQRYKGSRKGCIKGKDQRKIIWKENSKRGSMGINERSDQEDSKT